MVYDTADFISQSHVNLLLVLSSKVCYDFSGFFSDNLFKVSLFSLQQRLTEQYLRALGEDSQF